MPNHYQKLAFTVPVDENGNRIDTQSRAPAENMISPMPQDGSSFAPTQMSTPAAFYETPLFIGGFIFIVLVAIFISLLIITRKKKK